jgi:hypothetical protein
MSLTEKANRYFVRCQAARLLKRYEYRNIKTGEIDDMDAKFSLVKFTAVNENGTQATGAVHVTKTFLPRAVAVVVGRR